MIKRLMLICCVLTALVQAGIVNFILPPTMLPEDVTVHFKEQVMHSVSLCGQVVDRRISLEGNGRLNPETGAIVYSINLTQPKYFHISYAHQGIKAISDELPVGSNKTYYIKDILNKNRLITEAKPGNITMGFVIMPDSEVAYDDTILHLEGTIAHLGHGVVDPTSKRIIYFVQIDNQKLIRDFSVSTFFGEDRIFSKELPIMHNNLYYIDGTSKSPDQKELLNVAMHPVTSKVHFVIADTAGINPANISIIQSDGRELPLMKEFKQDTNGETVYTIDFERSGPFWIAAIENGRKITVSRELSVINERTYTILSPNLNLEIEDDLAPDGGKSSCSNG